MRSQNPSRISFALGGSTTTINVAISTPTPAGSTNGRKLENPVRGHFPRGHRKFCEAYRESQYEIKFSFPNSVRFALFITGLRWSTLNLNLPRLSFFGSFQTILPPLFVQLCGGIASFKRETSTVLPSQSASNLKQFLAFVLAKI